VARLFLLDNHQSWTHQMDFGPAIERVCKHLVIFVVVEFVIIILWEGTFGCRASMGMCIHWGTLYSYETNGDSQPKEKDKHCRA